MLRSKLLSIGIGTVFAFIIVISAVWCVSTYFEYKQRVEDDDSSAHAEANFVNTINDNRHATMQVLNYSDTSEQTAITANAVGRDFERYDFYIQTRSF